MRVPGGIGEEGRLYATADQGGAVASVVLKNRALNGDAVDTSDRDQAVGQPTRVMAARVLVDDDWAVTQARRKIAFVGTRDVTGQSDVERDGAVEGHFVDEAGRAEEPVLFLHR